MGQPFTFERRVEFRDTDAAGIMHFSVYFTYMEQAEHELFRQAGLSVVEKIDGQTISWPRVAAKCDYQQPFHFEDLIKIETSISKIGKTSLTFDFGFYNSTNQTQRVASGSITTVCCVIDELPPKSIAIPPLIKDKLSKFQV